MKTGSKSATKSHGSNGKDQLVALPTEEIVDLNPKPYDEKKAKDHFWKPDPGDDVLPKRKGFITDCVFRHRGKEVTTLFTIWSTLFTLSSAIKREAWLRFGEKRLFTNFYCILVGPAGIAHKTEAIDDATILLEGFTQYIESPEFKFMKAVNIIADKASPESLLEAFDPRQKEPKGVQGFWFKDKDGKQIINPATGRPMWYGKTSESSIVAHEFATFAGQQKYNTGLTDNLLALYECNRTFTWRTVKRKKIVLKNLHTTLIAGTTLTSFRNSLSENVRTDGFLSRSAIVYCPKTTGRRFSRPRIVAEAPCDKELQRRLAWIAEHGVGEFDLTPEADAYYDKWYCKWRDDLEDDTQFQGLKSRIHILVLKVALLFRLQRYEGDGPRLVDLQDIKDSIILVKKTWFESLPIMRGFEDTTAKPFIGRMEEYIRTRAEVDRLKLMRQGKFSAAEIREGLTMLCEEGKIEIWKGKESRSYPTTDGKETYRWCGERWLGSACLED
jgi:hypothetical protein